MQNLLIRAAAQEQAINIISKLKQLVALEHF